MSLNKLVEQLKARGNWGHSGRPGKVGGSIPAGSKLVGGQIAPLKGGQSQLQADFSSIMGKTRINEKVAQAIKKSAPGTRVGQLKVHQFQPGAYRKPMSYAIVTTHGNLATSADKNELKRIAQDYDVDLADRT